MREVSIRELRDLLQEMPLMAKIHPLSLAFLPEEVRIFQDAWQMAAELDSPSQQPTKPMLATCIEPALLHRLSDICCIHNPLTTELNQVILKRYSLIRENMFCQSQVADWIVKYADSDIIALIMVDGLSYADTLRYAPQELAKAKPILVDGVSITEQGMMRIIGKPPLANRLFDIGYCDAIGFSYWGRNEDPLTNRLFAGFGDQVCKVKSFDEVLKVLEDKAARGLYIQVVRNGLDGVAHQYREKPNKEAIVMDVYRDYERLVQLFQKKGLSASVHLVSDHGILWTDEHALKVYEFGRADHPRHYEYTKHSENLLNVEFEGKEFSMLGYPFIRRELRSNEWGVHGGLSFEESIAVWASYPIRKEKIE